MKRSHMWGLSLLVTVSCTSPAPMKLRAPETLPALDLGWLSLRDHFIATVGPNSGQGERMGPLVVMADATLAPKSSFPMHPHQDIEVLSWVVSGTLRHKDDHGGTDELPAGTLQLMSARDGIVHAEGNLRDEPVRLLQFWLEPTSRGGEPVYSKVSWAGPGFQLLAAREGAALSLRQDAQVYAAKVTGAKATLSLPKNRRAYGVSMGAITWNGQSAADGAGVVLQPGELAVEGTGQALVILIAP